MLLFKNLGWYLQRLQMPLLAKRNEVLIQTYHGCLWFAEVGIHMETMLSLICRAP